MTSDLDLKFNQSDRQRPLHSEFGDAGESPVNGVTKSDVIHAHGVFKHHHHHHERQS